VLSVLGNRTRLCDGITRREMLRIGGLAFTGLAWPDVLRAQASAGRRAPGRGRSSTFGRAKACIVVFNYGGPSHIDTFDPKPNAPPEIRGEFRPIPTRVPGTFICEHLPRMAWIADRYSIIRSMHHRDNDHAIGAYLALTGHSHPRHDVQGIEFPMSPTDMPSIGSVISKIRPTERPIFTYVTLGDLRHLGHHDSMGQGAGCLGRTYDPFTLPFVPPRDAGLDLSLVTSVTAEVDGARLGSRRALLHHLRTSGPALEQVAGMRNLDDFRRRAFELLAARTTRDAFNVGNEPARISDQYGPSPFGQNCLLARRLVEAGVPMVTVYCFGNRDWDTHDCNFHRLQNTLLPPTDQGMAALIEDLDQRGLLDETLVVWMSDMGRTPRINGGAGRDHWSFCYSVVLAGGGIRAGEVFGASDRSAAYPAERQVSPPDLAATIYHCLGIDPRTHVEDQQGRPLVVSTGNPIRALLES
jgi:hypothetical protein